MTYSPFKDQQHTLRNRILLITGIILVIGGVSYATATLLKHVASPSPATSQSQQTSPVIPSPAEALKIADAAKASAISKVAQGDQAHAITDYQTAYTNYKLAGATGAANDALFAVNSIKAVLAAPKNPAKPTDAKTSAK
jgi:hypothetical protein